MTDLRLRGSELTWRELDGELVAVDVPSSTYLSANRSGTLLWQRLSDGATRADLVDCLLAEFDLDRLRAEADVDAFLAALRERGLLER